MTEQADPALSHGELMEQSHIVYQKVEQSDLVHESHRNVETVWVYCDTVNLLLKPFGKFHSK